NQAGKPLANSGWRLSGRHRPGPAPSLNCCFGVEPRRNRTGDPIPTIGARVVYDALRHLTSPYVRAGEKHCQGVVSWGGVRLGIAHVLANLWHAMRPAYGADGDG